MVQAVYRHADHIRKALGIAVGERPRGQELVPKDPERLQPLLGAALRYTEATVAGLRADPTFATEEVSSILFPVSWGPVYDPEGMLEHGIVHVLCHRRQIERLLRFVTLLDRDVEIVIRPKAKGHASGMVSVSVA